MEPLTREQIESTKDLCSPGRMFIDMDPQRMLTLCDMALASLSAEGAEGVKRYALGLNGTTGRPDLFEDADGIVVLASDYAALMERYKKQSQK